MLQMKQQEKTLEKELNEMESSNLLDTEFKRLVIKMLKELGEKFNKERICIKKDTETNKHKVKNEENNVCNARYT